MAGFLRKAKIAEGAKSNGTILFLSLMLILIAFFIVLNGISSFEVQRTARVMQSLDDEFQKDKLLKLDIIRPTARGGDMLNPTDPLDQIGTLFATRLEVAKVDWITPGKIMSVHLPPSHLYVSDTDQIRSSHAGLLDRIARSLDTPGMSVSIHMGRGNDLDQNRLISLGRSLNARRIEAEKITLGIAPQAPPYLQLVFTKSSRIEPAWLVE